MGKKKDTLAQHYLKNMTNVRIYPNSTTEMHTWLTFNSTVLFHEGGRARQSVRCCDTSWGDPRCTRGHDRVTGRRVLTPVPVDLHVQEQLVLLNTPWERGRTKVNTRFVVLHVAGYLRARKRHVEVFKKHWQMVARVISLTPRRKQCQFGGLCTHTRMYACEQPELEKESGLILSPFLFNKVSAVTCFRIAVRSKDTLTGWSGFVLHTLHPFPPYLLSNLAVFLFFPQ